MPSLTQDPRFGSQTASFRGGRITRFGNASQFAEALEKALESKTTPLLVEGKIVGMAFSKAAAKELLSRQLAQQLAKDPSQLGRLITSLQEDPVEMSGL